MVRLLGRQILLELLEMFVLARLYIDTEILLETKINNLGELEKGGVVLYSKRIRGEMYL